MKKITLIISITLFIGACKKDKSNEFFDTYIVGYTSLLIQILLFTYKRYIEQSTCNASMIL
ncbi:MAG: hypothetical protein IPL21_03110 [Saprospirales bacterium]|nr:hypothetical protein [Saprospirales bacterium]